MSLFKADPNPLPDALVMAEKTKAAALKVEAIEVAHLLADIVETLNRGAAAGRNQIEVDFNGLLPGSIRAIKEMLKAKRYAIYEMMDSIRVTW